MVSRVTGLNLWLTCANWETELQVALISRVGYSTVLLSMGYENRTIEDSTSEYILSEGLCFMCISLNNQDGERFTYSQTESIPNGTPAFRIL
jgi:hypothetical protein